MKRSKQVKLVLITAALASCNRNMSPAGEDPSYTSDPVYYDKAMKQPLADTAYDSTHYLNQQASGSPLWYYSFNPNWYLYYPYYPYGYGLYSQQALIIQDKKNIARKGFGFGATTVSA